MCCNCIPIVCLAGKQIIMNVDNTVVYHSVNAGKSKGPSLMKLIRVLCFHTSTYYITYKCLHLSSEANVIADSLSGLDIPRFRLLYPQGDYLMTQLKEELILDF